MITITYFVHGTTTDNEEHISSGWKLDVLLKHMTWEEAFKNDWRKMVNGKLDGCMY